MVVEDNTVNQLVITSMLKKCGYQSDVAENGQQGVEAHSNNNYEVILMDCGMPVMDGFEATREIRKREDELDKTPAIIVALTAHAFDEVKGKCKEAGMDEFLTKPIQLKTIQDLLDSIMPKECKTRAKAS